MSRNKWGTRGRRPIIWSGYATVIVSLVILAGAATAFAGTREDLRFAEAMINRRWFDWAEDVVVDLVETSRNSNELRGWAAELHVTILDKWSKAANDETYSQKAEALRAKYKRIFPNHPAWGGPEAIFAELQREVEKAQKLASAAELEPDEEKRAQIIAQAVKMFEELGVRWEKLIDDLRKKVASYPPKEGWGPWAKEASQEEQEKLLQYIRQRNQAEYLYAMSFIYYSKVVSAERKKEILQKGLKKFVRFVEGEPEHDNDFDPAPRGSDKPVDPDVRDTYKMILYMSELGIGQCYLELGDFDKATEHFEYMVQAELPRGFGNSEVDLARLVDIRLQAYYLDGLTFNRAKKHKEAEMILREMLSRSGKEIHPDRDYILRYWKEKGTPEIALMPDVRKHPYGKLAAFQLAEALTEQDRFSEGMEEAYKIFAIEQAARKGGEVSPFEVEAAKKMSQLSEKVSTVKFPIGAAFAVAKGFYYQKKWDEAIQAFKKVYGSPGSPEEVREYAPKALFELGKLLYDRERNLEAGIALAEVCQRFPEFPQTSQAARLLKQSFRNHRQQVKKSGKITEFEEEKYDWAKKVALSAVPASLGPIRDTYTQAGEYMAEKKYELSAETYESVPKTFKETTASGKTVSKPVPFYALARAQLGLCLYQLYRARKKKSPQEALDHLKEAVKVLEEAINEAAEAEDRKAQVLSLYYLSRCLVEDVWKGKEATEYAKKAISYLAPFKGKFKDEKTAKSKMPDVLSTIALAHYKLKNYGKMHEAYLELEKKHKTHEVYPRVSFQFYEFMRKLGDSMAAAAGEEVAAPYYKKAAYYIYAWYKTSKNSLSTEFTLWVGQALHDTRDYAKASEALDAYFQKLPPKEKQTKEQQNQATAAKILLAQTKFGVGDFETAAGLFDLLRMIVVCPKCKYQTYLDPKDFDKPLPICPKCNRNDVKLEKVNDALLPIQEGAAKSYMAMFEKGEKNDMKALNKAQDIYQRIFKRLDPSNEKQLPKYWGIGHTILKIYYYKRDFDRIVGEIRNLILLSSADANPDNPTEEDWKRVIPVQPWRDKIRELFKQALEKTGKK